MGIDYNAEQWAALNKDNYFQRLATALTTLKRARGSAKTAAQASVKDLLDGRMASHRQTRWMDAAAESHWLGFDESLKDVNEAIRTAWRDARAEETMAVSAEPISLSGLPTGSWSLEVIFKLKKPLFSNNSTNFDVIDNPLRRDPVNHIPEFGGSSWKGSLRAAYLLEFGDLTSKKIKLHGSRAAVDRRLFGSLRGDSSVRQGRLSFFPTRFCKVGFTLINPIKRTPAQAQPILYEVVPATTEGTLQLLYVPFDRFTVSAERLLRQARVDALRSARAVRVMMDLGFGGKTSNGYGASKILGRSTFNCPGLPGLDERVWKELGL